MLLMHNTSINESS